MPETGLAHAELVGHPLRLATVGSLAKHPAAVYLARLAPGSRRVMRDSSSKYLAI